LFRSQDTQIMKIAFTAIGVASLAYGLASALGLAGPLHLTPRTMPFLGWAHVAGGVLFGAALAVSGLCPGTCVAKAGGGGGASRFSAWVAIAGLFAGALIYAALKPALLAIGVIASVQPLRTIHGALGLPYAAAALSFGALMVVATFAVDRLTREKLDRAEWSWAAAGTLGGILVVLSTAQG